MKRGIENQKQGRGGFLVGLFDRIAQAQLKPAVFSSFLVVHPNPPLPIDDSTTMERHLRGKHGIILAFDDVRPAAQ